MPKLSEIEGIGESYAKKLEKAGLKTTEDLLKKGATPKERKDVESYPSFAIYWVKYNLSKSSGFKSGKLRRRFPISPLGSIIMDGIPSVAVSSMISIPRPVLPLSVIPMITP